MQVMNVLSGITENEAQLVKTKVDGFELIEILLDNYITNRTAPERIPIIHYSGLIVDKTALLEAYDKGGEYEELAKCIKTQKDGEIIDLKKNYNLVNVVKYFNKMQNTYLREIGKRAKPVRGNAKALFEKHFDENKTINFNYEPRLF